MVAVEKNCCDWVRLRTVRETPILFGRASSQQQPPRGTGAQHGPVWKQGAAPRCSHVTDIGGQIVGIPGAMFCI
jgi:hypothetical protein